MKIKFPLALLLIIANLTFAQQKLYKAHQWNPTPTFFEIDEKDKALNSFAIKEKHLIQYYAPLLSQSVELFDTEHVIIHINSDKGVDMHNRVYIPMQNAYKLIDINARVIKPDGTVVNFKKENLKELNNVKGYGGFKIFAIEGLEKNNQLEYIYTVERRPQSLASINIQKDYLIKESEVIIRKSYKLKTSIKCYNGFPALKEEKVAGNKVAFTNTGYNIPPLVEEDFSAYNAYRQKVVYRMGFSETDNHVKWYNLAQDAEINYLNQKKYSKLVKEFEASEEFASDDSIEIKIEKFLKHHYTITDEYISNLYKIKTMYKYKKCTETGMIKLFCSMLNHYEIDYNLVITSNKFNHRFDETYFSDLNLEFPLIYLLKNDDYICPTLKNHTLGYAPSRYAGNKGVFISKDGYKFRKIKIANAAYTVETRNLNISVSPEDENVNINGSYSATGYRANIYRQAYDYYKDNELDDFKRNICSDQIEDADFTEFSVENEALNLNYSTTPLVLNYNFNSEEMIEYAGDDMMIPIGKVIGGQSELYQETKRICPIETGSNHKYIYKFIFKVPEGYKITNLDEFNFTKHCSYKNQDAAQFSSKADLDNNNLIIRVVESYNQTTLPLEKYDEFKNVINSAYDFSKLSLILESIQ